MRDEEEIKERYEALRNLSQDCFMSKEEAVELKILSWVLENE